MRTSLVVERAALRAGATGPFEDVEFSPSGHYLKAFGEASPLLCGVFCSSRCSQPFCAVLLREVSVASLDAQPVSLHRLAYWVERGGRSGPPTRITAATWRAWTRRLDREGKEAPGKQGVSLDRLLGLTHTPSYSLRVGLATGDSDLDSQCPATGVPAVVYAAVCVRWSGLPPGGRALHPDPRSLVAKYRRRARGAWGGFGVKSMGARRRWEPHIQ